VAAEKGLNKTLSSIESMEVRLSHLLLYNFPMCRQTRDPRFFLFGNQTSWSWTQNTEEVVADVAYDLFTSSTPGGRDEVEVMVWMAKNGNAAAISAAYSADGQPAPVDTVSLNGQSW